ALTGVLNYPDTCSLVTTTYTDFGKVQYIARSGLAYSIDYLPDGARGKSTWTSVDRTITRYYGDGSEKVYDTYGAERTISYLSCGGFVIEDWVLPSGLVDGRAGGSSDRDSLRASPPPSGPNPQPVSTSVLHGYYDAQGSLIALVTTGGTVVRRYAYDPWGRRVLPSDWTQPDTQADTYHINRGYTMHEHLDDFGLINMNGRVFDPLTAQFLSPDNYIQSDGNWLNYNRYAYCLNNPLKYTDPSGEIVWFIPVLICAAIGAYTGASIQSGTAAFWNWKSDSWKGAIAGAIVGATIGYGVASAIGASGIVASAGETIGVDAAGTVSSILNSGTVNITTNVITGGDWDSAWKAGVVGMVTGAWNVSGGFGMVKGLGAKTDIGKLTAKLGYQMIGTTMGSIGDNWVKGNNLFSKVVVGVGPINFTIGKGQKLLQWQNNKGNILVNTIGLGNCLFGGKVDFDWRNLSINYSGGVVDAFVPDSYSSGFGAHAIIGNKNLYGVIGHELHHLWQSRAYGDNYVLNYGLQGIDAFLNTGLLSSIISNDNYFERQAYGAYWW
ncbi:MAG: hypothetical protein J6T64_09290, partial [Bacteroidaceae bacterium]|nr:hypothetical protein [Bacteroidaceae bacterium]